MDDVDGDEASPSTIELEPRASSSRSSVQGLWVVYRLLLFGDCSCWELFQTLLLPWPCPVRPAPGMFGIGIGDTHTGLGASVCK